MLMNVDEAYDVVLSVYYGEQKLFHRVLIS